MGKTQHMLWRICLVALLALVLTVTMAVRLLRLQLAVPTEKAAENSPKTVGKTTVYTQSVEAMRGEILDRYGRPLVTNVVRYDLRFVYALWNRKTPNETILTLFALCDRYGLTYQDALPISLTEECYLTDRTGAEVIDRRLTNFLEARGWDTTIEADELMHRLRQHYGVDASLSYEDARRLIGLRSDLDCANFSSANPFAFLKGIPMELVLHVNEQQDLLPGVCVVTSYDRVYETEYAAHLLGYMGGIYREEYEALKAEGYALDDRVGKDGAEKAFESYLRGIDGYQKMRLDSDGRVVEVIEEQPAQAGNNVMLTLDIRLQAVVERALADQIELMVAEGIEDPTKAQDVAGGAAVVVDIATGDILASASYPTFDVSQFYALYSDLAEDPLKPMLNRAVGGIYSPGSIFKMVTSVAGLEQGIITPETIITDTGVYRFYKDYQPTCWIYTSSYGLTHGDETVVGALRDSCNIFFFDVGRQLGIEQLSTYARAFGFGEYTGIELNGESRGYVASPEAKKKLEGKSWVDGDTLAAAIGQSSNLFTPLQMANYIATLANGGTRYETHLLKYVCASDYSSVVTANQSVIAGRVEMSDLTYRTVMEGMSEVTENGTAAGAFKNYDIHVGGKTGSAQVATGTANSVFAAFAPFEDPKIAVVVVVEHGGSGNRIAPIARNIFDAYFALNDTFGQ
ncbi:MAG: penicillin-binding protein [Clostridia bacterium]|nr:penicillin-binding protein [Clostridia bacterium]